MSDIPCDIPGCGEAGEGLGQIPPGPAQADITSSSGQSPGSSTSTCSFLGRTEAHKWDVSSTNHP